MTLSNAKTSPRTRLLLGLGSCFVAILAGCVSGSKIRADAEVVKRDVARARELNAYRCAPRELAIAEAHEEFTEQELDQGDWLRADEHNQIATAAVKKALELSKDCGPKKVVVAPQSSVVIKKTDIDKDGIVDLEDKCPNDPEDLDGFEDEDGCPDLDNDQDGVPDVEDKCPNEPGPATNKGCPTTDRDNDGITDDVDKCPDEPEDLDKFEDEDGCPDLDNDQDSVPDVEDKCPNEPGPANSPEGKGCPRKYKLVKVNRESNLIEIKQKVLFQSGKWRILPASFKLLADVALVLKDFPNMKVSIEGHTDSQGSDTFNQNLSDQRASAVRDHLIKVNGIDPDRLESLGFGESKPINSNLTARGREANRRVEFRIVSE